jgi:signal transduction histidine kinase
MKLSKMKLNILLLLTMCYLIAPIILCAQNSKVGYLDSEDSLKIEHLQALASSLFMTDNQKCVEKLQEALIISQKSNDTLKNVELIFSIGKVYDYMNQFDLAEEYYSKACEIAFSKNEDSYFSTISNNLGVLYKRKGLSKKSLEEYLQSIKTKPTDATSIIHIGNIYNEWKNKNKAERYYQRAYEMIKDDSSEQSINAYLELGKVYLNQSDFRKSQRIFGEGFRIAQKKNIPKKELLFRYYLAVLNDSLGNKIKARTSLQQIYDKAIQKNDIQLAVLSLSSLSNTDKGIKENDKSMNDNIESFLLADSLNIITPKKELIKKIAEYYEKQGDYKQALSYQKQLERMNDSLFNIEKYRVTSELIFKNETSEQDKENLILQYKLNYNRQLFLYATVFLSIFLILGIIQFLLFLRIRALNSSLKNQVSMVKKKTEELKLVNKRLNRTFSIIGHDLRAQVSSIISFFDYLEVVQFDSFQPEQLKMAQSTQRDALNVLDLLENLLNWGKAQSQKINFGENNFSIQVITEKVEEYIQHRAEQKGVHFIADISYGGVCHGDSNMIYTVLRNLVANSLKFTPSGGQIILSSRKDDTLVTFELRDTGVGMSQEVINKIFNKKESFTSQGTNNELGSGLGLGVCIDFIELHQSKMIVKSEPGKGTSISFCLKQ